MVWAIFGPLMFAYSSRLGTQALPSTASLNTTVNWKQRTDWRNPRYAALCVGQAHDGSDFEMI